MKRRGQGEGSLYQQPDGRWRAQVDLGWQDGRRVRRSVSAATRREDGQSVRATPSARRGQGVCHFVVREAHHEAGHAVAAEAVAIPVVLLTLGMYGEPGHAYCRVTARPLQYADADDIRRRIVHTLAGPAVDYVFGYSRGTWRHSADSPSAEIADVGPGHHRAPMGTHRPTSTPQAGRHRARGRRPTPARDANRRRGTGADPPHRAD